MEGTEFWKMQGSGNDFILIDNRAGKISEKDMAGLVQPLCMRRMSVGADGLIFIMGSKTHDFSWRFFNADGGEVEMCGNGSRCAARFAYLNGIAGPEMTFETLAGTIKAVVNGRTVKVLMPVPSRISNDIALVLDDGFAGDKKTLPSAPEIPGGLSRMADFINTGVPHAVIRVKDIHNHNVKAEGRAVRYHPRFAPAGTNADFMVVTGPNDIMMRTYERGVEGETLACGTGAIACALTSAARGDVVSPVRVKTAGGETLVIYFEVRKDGFEKVFLEGNTSLIYKAVLGKEAF
ncbi:diaminopimelate epimerase [bacterium]|nr:diaminopimelate epimerase [bacterium]